MDRKEHYKQFDEYLQKSRKEFDDKLNSRFLSTNLFENFELLVPIGKGSFGTVVITKYIPDKTLYAMKILEKEKLVKRNQVKHSMSEIRFLDAMNFRFIVTMEYFFQDNVYLYMVMPFVRGGDMFALLKKMKKFDENLTKFYAAQVILAFEYMHYMGVIYRDIKPENILIEKDGYIKVTDLGFTKKVDNSRTYSLCGTPEYLAPEVILCSGYNTSVDWWGLGILIFEMAAGVTPFNAKEPMKIYEKIVGAKITYPNHFSITLRDLLSNLLQVDRTKRFGVMKKGSKDIKEHEWFRTIGFHAIFNKRYRASYIPRCSKDEEFQNCFSDFELRFNDTVEFESEFREIRID